ncbi:MAG: trimethylamine methyltransferase family protein, partial [Pseudomonadota bacterium]
MTALPPEPESAPPLRESGARRRRRRPAVADGAEGPPAPRSEAYRTLRNPFPAVPVFTEDRIVAIHEAALDVLERLGVCVLLPEGRALFAAGGC